MTTTTSAALLAAELGLDRPRPLLLRFSQLTIDKRVQRAESNQAKLKVMSDHFNPAVLQHPAVSVRDNGEFILLDGDHRRQAAEANGWDEQLAFDAWYGLTLAQEAALFRLLNTNVKVGSIDLYRVALNEGVPEMLAIQAVLDKYGLVAGIQANHFKAVGAAQRIASTKGGIAALDWAIGTYVEAWGLRHKPPVDALTIQGLAMFFQRYGETINQVSLAKKLASLTQGTVTLLAQARAKQQIRKGKLAPSTAEVLVELYNGIRGVRKLPEWER